MSDVCICGHERNVHAMRIVGRKTTPPICLENCGCNGYRESMTDRGDVSDPIKKLREIEQAMTPGPWFAHPAPVPPFETSGAVWGPDGDAVADAYGSLPDGVDDYANSCGISAMRNLFPLLLDVVEAAAEVRPIGDGFHNDLPVLRLRQALGSFLAALEEEEEA